MQGCSPEAFCDDQGLWGSCPVTFFHGSLFWVCVPFSLSFSVLYVFVDCLERFRIWMKRSEFMERWWLQTSPSGLALPIPQTRMLHMWAFLSTRLFHYNKHNFGRHNMVWLERNMSYYLLSPSIEIIKNIDDLSSLSWFFTVFFIHWLIRLNVWPSQLL